MEEPEGLVLRTGKRRYRSTEEKRRIVEEALSSGVSVAMVARRHGMNANQLFQWRKLYQSGLLKSSVRETATNATRLLPVAVVADPEAATSQETHPTPSSPVGVIHVEFPGRVLIRVECGADPTLLRAIVESLRR